jgi:hypothetical protein
MSVTDRTSKQTGVGPPTFTVANFLPEDGVPAPKTVILADDLAPDTNSDLAYRRLRQQGRAFGCFLWEWCDWVFLSAAMSELRMLFDEHVGKPDDG